MYAANKNPRSDPTQVSIDISASGDLVALVANKRILVVSLSIRLATSNTVAFQSGGSTALTGAMTLTALDWQYNPAGWLKTAAGEKLNLVLGSGVQTSGTLTYILIDG